MLRYDLQNDFASFSDVVHYTLLMLWQTGANVSKQHPIHSYWLLFIYFRASVVQCAIAILNCRRYKWKNPTRRPSLSSMLWASSTNVLKFWFALIDIRTICYCQRAIQLNKTDIIQNSTQYKFLKEMSYIIMKVTFKWALMLGDAVRLAIRWSQENITGHWLFYCAAGILFLFWIGFE